MEELIKFVENKIADGSFIGLNTSEENGTILYTVDYWETITTEDSLGAEVEIKAGKQKTYTL